MKVYLVGTSVSKNELKIQTLFKKSHKLHSYYYIPQLEKNWFAMNTKNKVQLFLDSGAFSAWSQGEVIDIQEYITFIKDNEKYIDLYSNLDDISDPKTTWKNQQIMKKAGLSPVPVFHYGEDIKWLKRILSKGYGYISLGGMVPIHNKDLIPWLDDLWDTYLTDNKGFPITKVHGFGLTSLPVMLRYPWYSVDSTSWVITGRMGGIYMPERKNNKWVFGKTSYKVSVSNKSSNIRKAGQHYETMSPLKQKLISQYLNEKGYCFGISEFKKEPQSYELQDNEKWSEKKPKDKDTLRKVEIIIEKGVSNTYQLRDEINILYFLDLEKSFQKWPWRFKNSNTVNKLFG